MQDKKKKGFLHNSTHQLNTQIHKNQLLFPVDAFLGNYLGFFGKRGVRPVGLVLLSFSTMMRRAPPSSVFITSPLPDDHLFSETFSNPAV